MRVRLSVSSARPSYDPPPHAPDRGVHRHTRVHRAVRPCCVVGAVSITTNLPDGTLVHDDAPQAPGMASASAIAKHMAIPLHKRNKRWRKRAGILVSEVAHAIMDTATLRQPRHRTGAFVVRDIEIPPSAPVVDDPWAAVVVEP